MNIGYFHLCTRDWCLQSGTKEQYTRCEEASEDGRTCYSPTIRYGSTIGGHPTKHTNTIIREWCQQLFPTLHYGDFSVTYSDIKPKNYIGALFWCSKYDENNPHWCDWQDGNWKDSTLNPQPFNKVYPVIDSVTC